MTPTPDFVSIALAARAIAAPDARVAIAGVSGAGKTTLATRLSSVAGIPHTEGVIRWAISTRRKYRALVAATRAERPELPVLRLRTRRDVEALIDAVSTTQD